MEKSTSDSKGDSGGSGGSSSSSSNKSPSASETKSDWFAFLNKDSQLLLTTFVIFVFLLVPNNSLNVSMTNMLYVLNTFQGQVFTFVLLAGIFGLFSYYGMQMQELATFFGIVTAIGIILLIIPVHRQPGAVSADYQTYVPIEKDNWRMTAEEAAIKFKTNQLQEKTVK